MSTKANQIQMDGKEVSFGLNPDQLEPLHDLVLVRLLRPDETPGGLTIVSGIDDLVPESVRAKTPQKARLGTAARAEVIAVGPGRLTADGARLPVCVAPGDVILMPPPRALGGLGDNMFMIHEADIEFRYHVTGKGN